MNWHLFAYWKFDLLKSRNLKIFWFICFRDNFSLISFEQFLKPNLLKFHCHILPPMQKWIHNYVFQLRIITYVGAFINTWNTRYWILFYFYQHFSCLTNLSPVRMLYSKAVLSRPYNYFHFFKRSSALCIIIFSL